MPTFKDLKIYQEGLRLMLEVDRLCKELPIREEFQLIDQATRSSSSDSTMPEKKVPKHRII